MPALWCQPSLAVTSPEADLCCPRWQIAGMLAYWELPVLACKQAAWSSPVPLLTLCYFGTVCARADNERLSDRGTSWPRDVRASGWSPLGRIYTAQSSISPRLRTFWNLRHGEQCAVATTDRFIFLLVIVLFSNYLIQGTSGVHNVFHDWVRIMFPQILVNTSLLILQIHTYEHAEKKVKIHFAFVHKFASLAWLLRLS